MHEIEQRKLKSIVELDEERKRNIDTWLLQINEIKKREIKRTERR